MNKVSIPHSGSYKKSYRPEIDGLRALAVIAVITNHFNKDILPSGYLGVDIFFVISGFVITSSIANRPSKHLGDFLLEFYNRRIKRLVPALVLFVLINSVLICLFNPNPETSIKTGIASLFGLSNILLRSSNYFAESANLNIFTHTWSLGVEEQFYFLFPFIVWFTGFSRMATKGTRNLFLLMVSLSTASLLAFIILYQSNQSAAYFLMPTRFWEMGVGCLLSLSLRGSNYLNSSLTPFPLLLLISIVAVFFIPLQFAIIATIAVIILTSILIVSLRPDTAAYQLFTQKPVIYIGLISYSLYLWHWSVLSISCWTIGIHWWSVPIQLGLMFLFAIVSYRYLENPLRRVQWSAFPWRSIVYGLAISLSSSIFVLTINFFRSNIYQGGNQVYEDNKIYQSLVSPCKKECSQQIFIIGDSHAGHLGALFEKLKSNFQLSIYLHARGSGINGATKVNFINPVLETYKNQINSGDLIVISTFLKDGITKKLFDEYTEAISLANIRGAKIILFNPTPYFSKMIPYSHCNIAWYRPKFVIPEECNAKVSRSKLKSEILTTIKVLDKLAANYKNVFVFDAFSVLCPESNEFCKSSKNSRSLYKDDNHLSSYGAISLYDNFTNFLFHHNLIKKNSTIE